LTSDLWLVDDLIDQAMDDLLNSRLEFIDLCRQEGLVDQLPVGAMFGWIV
jgi:hypothetical protein